MTDVEKNMEACVDKRKGVADVKMLCEVYKKIQTFWEVKNITQNFAMFVRF